MAALLLGTDLKTFFILQNELENFPDLNQSKALCVCVLKLIG